MKITQTAKSGIRPTSAAHVSVTDTGGNFSGTDLETILAEVATRSGTATVLAVIDGGGVAITTGVKCDVTLDVACTIDRWTLLADQSGSIVVDIWKDTYANAPPTIADVITAAAKPTITAALKGQSSTLTGWTTSIAAGDVLRFNVNSVTTIQRVTLALRVRKT
jgi:hypothetical protein